MGHTSLIIIVIFFVALMELSSPVEGSRRTDIDGIPQRKMSRNQRRHFIMVCCGVLGCGRRDRRRTTTPASSKSKPSENEDDYEANDRGVTDAHVQGDPDLEQSNSVTGDSDIQQSEAEAIIDSGNVESGGAGSDSGTPGAISNSSGTSSAQKLGNSISGGSVSISNLGMTTKGPANSGSILGSSKTGGLTSAPGNPGIINNQLTSTVRAGDVTSSMGSSQGASTSGIATGVVNSATTNGAPASVVASGASSSVVANGVTNTAVASGVSYSTAGNSASVSSAQNSASTSKLETGTSSQVTSTPRIINGVTTSGNVQGMSSAATTVGGLMSGGSATSVAPVVTSLPPGVTSLVPVVTTPPPVVTSLTTVLTTLPAVVTSLLPVVTSLPPVVTSLPTTMTSLPTVLTTLPPVVISTSPIVTSILPGDVTSSGVTQGTVINERTTAPGSVTSASSSVSMSSSSSSVGVTSESTTSTPQETTTSPTTTTVTTNTTFVPRVDCPCLPSCSCSQPDGVLVVSNGIMKSGVTGNWTFVCGKELNISMQNSTKCCVMCYKYALITPTAPPGSAPLDCRSEMGNVETQDAPKVPGMAYSADNFVGQCEPFKNGSYSSMIEEIGACDTEALKTKGGMDTCAILNSLVQREIFINSSSAVAGDVCTMQNLNSSSNLDFGMVCVDPSSVTTPTTCTPFVGPTFLGDLKRYHMVGGYSTDMKAATDYCAKLPVATTWKLAEIETQEENDLIKMLLNSLCQRNNLWTAGYEVSSGTPTYWWSSNSLVTYTDWASSSPIGGSNFGIMLDSAYNYQWSKCDRNWKIGFLCELK